MSAWATKVFGLDLWGTVADPLAFLSSHAASREFPARANWAMIAVVTDVSAAHVPYLGARMISYQQTCVNGE